MPTDATVIQEDNSGWFSPSVSPAMFKSLIGACCAALLLLLLSGYGIGAPSRPPLPDPDAPARLELLLSSSHGMEGLVVQGDAAYLTLSDPTTLSSNILTTHGVIRANSLWGPLIHGAPAMRAIRIAADGNPSRHDAGDRYAIRQPVADNGSRVAITHLLSPSSHPDVTIAAGHDVASGKPYLAWSPDQGQRWIDLSGMLPGSDQIGGMHRTDITSLVEDARGRLLLTMNEDNAAKGRLMALTLGKKMDWLLL